MTLFFRKCDFSELCFVFPAKRFKTFDFVSELKSGSSDISIKLRGLESHLSIEGTGNVFTRWGRTSCPGNGTELIYDGYAAGSHYTDNGAAANYLCLPKNPIWNKWRDGSQNGPSVFGAEYEFDDIDRTTFFGHEVRDNDVPCAVCRTKRSSVMMIPARNECFDGLQWNTLATCLVIARLTPQLQSMYV